MWPHIIISFNLFVCMQVYMQAYVCKCVYRRVCKHMYASVYAGIYLQVCMQVYVCRYVHVYGYICACRGQRSTSDLIFGESLTSASYWGLGLASLTRLAD